MRHFRFKQYNIFPFFVQKYIEIYQLYYCNKFTLLSFCCLDLDTICVPQGLPSLTEGMKGSSASGCNVSAVFFSIFYRPGADKHFHMGINIVTGCVVANFLLLVHAACAHLSVFVCSHVWMSMCIFGRSKSSFQNWSGRMSFLSPSLCC